MVRFSCFNTQINGHKPKKAGLSFTELMHMLQASSKTQATEAPLSAEQLAFRANGENNRDILCNRIVDYCSDWKSDGLNGKAGFEDKDAGVNQIEASVSAQWLAFGANGENGSKDKTVDYSSVWKSDDTDGKSSFQGEDAGVDQTAHLKKSQSESGLLLKGSTLADEDTEDESHETNGGFFCDLSDEINMLILPDRGNKSSSCTNTGKVPTVLDPFKESSLVNGVSIFSIGDPWKFEKGAGQEFSDTPSSGEHEASSGKLSPQTPHLILRSRSLPHIGTLLPPSEDHIHVQVKSRSSNETKMRLVHELGQDEHCSNTFDYGRSTREWIMPIEEHSNFIEYGSSSDNHHLDNILRKDFKLMRIEEWVDDLQPCFPIEEADEMPHPDDKDRESRTLRGSITPKKTIPGMEAAKRYISSLNPSSTAAQLSNNGLTVIPFLSAFVSLKVVNLSGNGIVRMTAGALPRGLHALNLSKNQISAIEGLRELTRLRVLDLSYNRIFRIGHGLASCSSLKEIYLVGNKISEVEGLHRLLKLSILDLRYNKISTAKCVGQLAANYNSLQAISLEGNPAQKNVGEEQLRKHLQGLLPKLTYYNRQPTKMGTAKDNAERSVRLGVGSHKTSSSRYKSLRKVGGGISRMAASSSGHVGRNHGLGSDRSNGKQGKFPPSNGAKASSRHHNHPGHHQWDVGENMRSLRQELRIRRICSEGTLGAL
ncbi:hypothetical protein SAY86_024768 [Trapa natans]|uniref:Uncharacterized protein n=1 Tax=Trapa natans TaxID=22666 RepID=A0AAN7MVH1_TRANT|nr:hypothetical protein SAY86_024768 [Trapa natans]